jgi:hypothetical protein
MMVSLGVFARRGDPNALANLGVTWSQWPAQLLFDATPAETAITVTPQVRRAAATEFRHSRQRRPSRGPS